MNKYLEKIAKSSELQEQQERGIDKLLQNGGVLLDHSTGSGKTRTILEAAHRIQKSDKNGKQLIITPASLTTNIEKERKKHGIPLNMKNVEVISYEKAVNDADRLSKNNYSFVALDEAHKLRNTDTKRFSNLEKLILNSKHRLLATATSRYNSAENMSPLVNLAAGKKVMPEDKKEFENRYIKRTSYNPGLVAQFLLGKKPEEKVELTNKKELKTILDKYVDRYDSREDPSAKDKFPERREETIEIPMSKQQERLYGYLEGKIPFLIRMKIRNNLPLDKKEKQQLNAFSTGVRQVSNSVRPYVSGKADASPKVKKAVEELQRHMKSDKNFRGVVYSNFIGAGLTDYSDELKKAGVQHAIYHGGLSKKEKDSIRDAYNEGKLPVMLVSSSGTEGLDLKGTKLMQVMEPHYNKSKIDQVMGRGDRYESHAHLPKEERVVKVQHYLSTFSPGFFGGKKKHTIDQYLKENSADKEEVSEKFKELMRDEK